MKTSFRLTRLSLLVVIAITTIGVTLPSRSFAAEHSLAGIKIFSSISVVLQRFGGPTIITSGYQPATVLFTYSRPTLVDPDLAGGMGQGGPRNFDTGMQPMGGAATQSDPFDPLYDGASRYYYDLPQKGLIYEFVATSAGRIVEIKVYGYHGNFRTAAGIGLGDDYAEIGLKYGYPDQTISQISMQDTPLTLIYADKAHVSFELIRNKVAVISVVAPD